MKKEHKIYLDKLRASGRINMYGAGLHLQNEFGLDRKDAREILLQWMKTFND
jgi:hypothetical protein